MTKSASFHLLLLWHGLLAGGYTIAYFTADEARALHNFAGYVVLALLAVRLVAAALSGEKSSWGLPWASMKLWQAFWHKLSRWDLSVFLQRTPLVSFSGLAILVGLTFVSISGLAAGWWDWEDFHEGIAEGSPALILVHIGLVVLAPALKRFSSRSHSEAVAPQT